MQAILIQVCGRGVAIDMTVYNDVRHRIGQAVSKEVIDRFQVFGYAREGRFSACAESRHSLPRRKFDQFFTQLKMLETDVSTTAYSVKMVDSCDIVSPMR